MNTYPTSHNDHYKHYHELAKQGGQAHLAGDFSQALQFAKAAHEALTAQSFDLATAHNDLKGLNPEGQDLGAQNLRNIGARFERQGKDQSALEAMEAAAALHQDLLDKDPSSSHCRREVAADKFYLGAFALKAAILKELADNPTAAENGQRSVEHMHDSAALFDAAAGSDGNRRHQYHINGMGRFSMAEGLYGGRARGIRLGVRACWMALSSEPTLPPSERTKAVAKALARGIGAVAVSALSLVNARTSALKLAKKLL